MKPFPRRLYANFGEFWDDIRFIMANRPMIRRTMRGELVSAQFRERLMLTVTEVNGCRYCSYYHAQEALRSGISEESLKTLLGGSIPEDTPKEEIPALVYAQHWAEHNAHPDPEMYQKLLETYGEEKTLAIHIALRMIRVGNLTGNLLDYIIYRLSCGRFGLREEDREFVV
jgi:AhpD family alkylhydroperoxidase